MIEEAAIVWIYIKYLSLIINEMDIIYLIKNEAVYSGVIYLLNFDRISDTPL